MNLGACSFRRGSLWALWQPVPCPQTSMRCHVLWILIPSCTSVAEYPRGHPSHVQKSAAFLSSFFFLRFYLFTFRERGREGEERERETAM